MLKYFHKHVPLRQRSSTATRRIARNAVKDRLLNGNRVFRFARVRILVSILSVLCVLCGYSSAQEWKSVADGVEYAEVRREFSGKSVNINLLRLDLKKVRLDVHHAMDAAIGTEKTSSIATRHKAFAAINAGFFRLDTSIWAGDSTGALVINRRFLSEPPQPRIALYIHNGDDRTETIIGIQSWRTFLWFNEKQELAAKINTERSRNDLVIYTPQFGRTTLTEGEGVEVIVRKAKIVKILDRTSSNQIPSDGFVISATGRMREEVIKAAKVGRSVGPGFEFSGAGISGVEDIVGGVPQLIKNSKIDITWEKEKSSKAFVETRHPRTAVAKLKDGKFLMLTADGRTEQSAGLDLYDLAAYFLELGATDAMNLDGGGSTTMFLDGKVVNKPSDKEGERKVSDAILVTLRKPVSKKRN